MRKLTLIGALIFGIATPAAGAANTHPFSATAARRAVSAYEKQWGPLWRHERIGRCHWRSAGVAACAVRFHGQIVKPQPGVRFAAVSFVWIDRVHEVGGRLVVKTVMSSLAQH